MIILIQLKDSHQIKIYKDVEIDIFHGSKNKLVLKHTFLDGTQKFVEHNVENCIVKEVNPVLLDEFYGGLLDV